jgi:hypothetical protein
VRRIESPDQTLRAAITALVTLHLNSCLTQPTTQSLAVCIHPGVLLCKRDTFLTRAEYTQLVYLACSAWRRKGSAPEGPETIPLEPPALVFPRTMWTGKQVGVSGWTGWDV